MAIDNADDLDAIVKRNPNDFARCTLCNQWILKWGDWHENIKVCGYCKRTKILSAI